MRGCGRGGGIEITNQNDENRRLVSIRQAYSIAKNNNLKTLGIYTVVWLYWWFVLMHYNQPRLPPWETFKYVFEHWGKVMGWTLPLWLVPFPIQWAWALRLLNKKNLIPKIKNDNWPPEMSQMTSDTS